MAQVGKPAINQAIQDVLRRGEPITTAGKHPDLIVERKVSDLTPQSYWKGSPYENLTVSEAITKAEEKLAYLQKQGLTAGEEYKVTNTRLGVLKREAETPFREEGKITPETGIEAEKQELYLKSRAARMSAMGRELQVIVLGRREN